VVVQLFLVEDFLVVDQVFNFTNLVDLSSMIAFDSLAVEVMVSFVEVQQVVKVILALLVFVPAQVAGFRGSIVRSNLVAIELNIKL